MNKLILILLVFLAFGFTNKKYQDVKTIALEIIDPDVIEIQNLKPSDELDLKGRPYEIKFDINTIDENRAVLEVAMKICIGCYYVSPYSKGDFKGRFTIVLETNKHLNKDVVLLEIPQSKESIDPWGNGPVNFVKENTIYKQELTIKTQENFNVPGWIQFVIEPKCTLERIPFFISNTSGILKMVDGC